MNTLDLAPYHTMTATDSPESALASLGAAGQEWILLLDDEQRPVRWLRDTDLRRSDRPFGEMGQLVRARVEPNATLHDTLEEMLQSSTGSCCVVDNRGRLQGVVEMHHLTEVMHSLQAEARAHYDGLEATS